MIGTMVGDVLAETERRVARGRRRDDRRGSRARAGRWPASRPRWPAEERALKRFLYARLYESPELDAGARARRSAIVANLAAAYRADPGAAARRLAARRPARRRGCARIGDFIAGMTDRFAIARHEELVGPGRLPDRF